MIGKYGKQAKSQGITLLQKTIDDQSSIFSYARGANILEVFDVENQKTLSKVQFAED